MPVVKIMLRFHFCAQVQSQAHNDMFKPLGFIEPGPGKKKKKIIFYASFLENLI